MTKLEEKAAEYSFNIPSKVYQSCKTQEEMKLWKDEIEHAYIQAYDQAMQDFLEKAEKILTERMYFSDDEAKEFKNYMKNEM